MTIVAQDSYLWLLFYQLQLSDWFYSLKHSKIMQKKIKQLLAVRIN